MDEKKQSDDVSGRWGGCWKTRESIMTVLSYLYHGFVVGLLVWLFFSVRNQKQQSRDRETFQDDLLKLQIEFKILKSFCHQMMNGTVLQPLAELTPHESDLKREVIGSNKVDLSALLRGRDGRDGAPGPQGHPGVQGPPGTPGQDAFNIVTVNHYINTTINKLADQVIEKVKLQAKRIPSVSGSNYIRWGRSVCPSHSSLVYSGRAAGEYYAHSGGSSELVCLPNDPEYLKTNAGNHGRPNALRGVEYQIDNNNNLFSTKNINDHNAPCAVCMADGRTTKIVIPAKVRCPDSSWTLEYQGFLMSERETHYRSQYSCVDKDAESVPGSSTDQNGALLYHTGVDCETAGTIEYCPPYQHQKELSCVVCSK